MDVGVRELKMHLSEYVAKAAKGEVIRVTDRGRPKAILGPVPEGLGVDRGIQEKWVRPGAASTPTPVRRQRANRKVMDVLREDRDR